MTVPTIAYNDNIDIRVIAQDDDKVLVLINAKNVTSHAQAVTWMPQLESARDTLSPSIKAALDADGAPGCRTMSNDNLANHNGSGLTIFLKKRQSTVQEASKSVWDIVERIMNNMRNGPDVSDDGLSPIIVGPQGRIR